MFKLARVPGGWIFFVVVTAGCGLVAKEEPVSDWQLDASYLDVETSVPVVKGGSDAGVKTASWCAEHASPSTFSCLDFDESFAAPKAPEQTNCAARVQSSPIVLSNSGPNMLTVSCAPAGTNDLDFIPFGDKTSYASPNGIALNADVYLTPVDPSDGFTLFRVGLADHTWWIQYEYIKDSSGPTGRVREFTAADPKSGMVYEMSRHAVPQMVMSESPAWYHVIFAADLVRHQVWLAFSSDAKNPAQTLFTGGATNFIGSFSISDTSHFTQNNQMEVRWGLVSADGPFQQNYGTLALHYDNVDIEPVPTMGILDSGPVFR